jgi:uncharacterized protein DUF2752
VTMSAALARVAAGLWAAMIVATLVIGALAPADWRAAVANDGPGCPFRATTGVDCPFCGMTRATVTLGGGDLGAALALHPLAPLVLAGVFALMIVVAIGRTDALLRGRRPLILLAAIAAVWIARLVLR